MNDTNLYVGCPNIGNREAFLARVGDILDRRRFTNNGPLVQEFEGRIAQHVGVKHCVAMCNATVALEIACRALDLKGEVLIPSFTFVATAHALQWQEITPVFVDIDPLTHNLDPTCIERLITPKTTGIIGVHLWGRPCQTDKIQEVATRHGLKAMYDASHAFGCSSSRVPIGQCGSCEVFSFHTTKFINSFEGGVVVTNDDELAEKMRLMRNFGFAGFDRVIYPGVNGKMSEICAAMGLTSLEAMDEILSVNRRNYRRYVQGLQGLSGVRLLEYASVEESNCQYIVVEIDAEDAGVTRDGLITQLHEQGIIARRYFWPGCHRMEPYASLQPNAYLLLPETERIAARVIVLPTGQTITEESVDRVCGVICGAVRPIK